MNYRHVELLGLTTLNADKTVEIDLDMADPISQIFIDHRVTNGIGTAMTAHPIAAITKVEIVDGSEVLFSLDGYCTEGLDIYHAGQHPRGGWYHALNGIDTDRVVAMNFGRWPWDEVLAFDPKKFRNPKLKIAYDIDAGGMAPSACKLGVFAGLFDEKVISPLGFLMAKEIKSWTTVATQHEYTELPTDYPYRKLLLRGTKESNPPHWILGRIKLAEDQDKRIIIDQEFRPLLFNIGRQNAFITEDWNVALRATQNVYYVTPTMECMATGSGWEAAIATADIACYDGDGGHLEAIASGVGNATLHVQGWAPHGMLQIPFGLQDKIEDWYDVTKIGSLKLDITDGVDDATSKIFLQQYRTY